MESPYGKENPSPDEEARFQDLTKRAEAAIRLLAERTGAVPRQGFHAKQHGCARGTLRIPKQKIDNPTRDRFCTSLSYSPWYGIEEHRLLGDVMRMRKLIYQRSQELRGPLPPDPTGAENSP